MRLDLAGPFLRVASAEDRCGDRTLPVVGGTEMPDPDAARCAGRLAQSGLHERSSNERPGAMDRDAAA